MKIEDIKGEAFIFGLLSLLFLIAPGIAVIYLQNPLLISELDWIKLIFLSVSIVTPTGFLLIVFFTVNGYVSNPQNNDIFIPFSFGLIVNGIVIYAILVLNYFFPRPLYQYFILVAIIHLLFIIKSIYKVKMKNK